MLGVIRGVLVLKALFYLYGLSYYSSCHIFDICIWLCKTLLLSDTPMTFLFSYIYPSVGLTDVYLVAVSTWDFVDILVFQVDVLLFSG